MTGEINFELCFGKIVSKNLGKKGAAITDNAMSVSTLVLPP